MATTKRQRVYFTAWGQAWRALAREPAFALGEGPDDMDAVKRAIGRALGGAVWTCRTDSCVRRGAGWLAHYCATVCRSDGRVIGEVWFHLGR